MRFEVHIGTSGAAFKDEETDAPRPEEEVARILRELANRMDPTAEGLTLVPEQPIRLSDINGNRVGFAVLTDPIANLRSEE